MVHEHAHERLGDGPPVMFIHGGVLCGALTWAQQRPLADAFSLIILDRFGYGPGQESMADDHAADVAAIADWLPREPMHLVGQSSGAIVAMDAASRVPENVISLTLCEPPFWTVASGNPAVNTTRAELEALFDQPDLSDMAWLALFAKAAGAQGRGGLPPPQIFQGVSALRRTQMFPWDLTPDFRRVAAARFPKLVVSGDHSAAYEAVADRLTEMIGARRAHLPGAGHSIPSTGAPFNDLLRGFLAEAQSGLKR